MSTVKTDPVEQMHREYIQKARELMPVAEVKLNAVPKWLLDRLRLAIKEGRLDSPGSYARFPDMLLMNSSLSGRWLDHWGTCPNKNIHIPVDRLFVTEPYPLGAEGMQEVINFAEVLDLEFEVLSRSWWFPGHTIRIEFWPSEPTAIEVQ